MRRTNYLLQTLPVSVDNSALYSLSSLSTDVISTSSDKKPTYDRSQQRRPLNPRLRLRVSSLSLLSQAYHTPDIELPKPGLFMRQQGLVTIDWERCRPWCVAHSHRISIQSPVHDHPGGLPGRTNHISVQIASLRPEKRHEPVSSTRSALMPAHAAVSVLMTLVQSQYALACKTASPRWRLAGIGVPQRCEIGRSCCLGS